jgi:hypothetical protein
LGGYHATTTLTFALFIGFSISIASFFIVLENHMVTALILFWVTLCNGALLLPIVIGIMLTKVEPEMRATANSFANFMYNLLGFFPAPFIYGLANELSDTPKTSRWGMTVVMIACCLVTLFIYLAILSDK